VGGNIFFSPKRTDRLWGPPSLMLSGYLCSFPRLKRPGREVNQSPQSNVEVKNEWSLPSSPVCTFVTWAGQLYHYCRVTARDRKQTVEERLSS